MSKSLTLVLGILGLTAVVCACGPAALADGEEGGACLSSGGFLFGSRWCNGSLVCNQGVCQKEYAVGAGGACWYPVNCAPGLVCAWGVCTEKGGVGDWCRSDDYCSGALRCLAGNTHCDYDSSCASGACGMPQPHGVGFTCSSDAFCEPGLRCLEGERQCYDDFGTRCGKGLCTARGDAGTDADPVDATDGGDGGD